MPSATFYYLSSGILRLAGQALAKRYPEIFESSKHYTFPNPPQSVKVKVQVMQRVKGRGVDLAGQKEMAQIRTGTCAAGITVTGGVRRTIVFGMPRVLDVEPTFTGEQLAIPRIPRR
jgi:hypothetical protein